MKVIDINGKVITTHNMNADKTVLDVKDLKKGLYYLHISYKSKFEIREILKD